MKHANTLTPARQKFLDRVGADLRDMRMASGLSQEDIADYMGWKRDAISKVENGRNQLSVYDYLTLMRFFREIEPNHPALPLADRYMPRASRSDRDTTART